MAGRLLGSRETERCSALPKMGETGLAVSLLMDSLDQGHLWNLNFPYFKEHVTFISSKMTTITNK